MAQTTCQALLKSNPDVSGIGIRVSFYGQSILLLLLGLRSSVADHLSDALAILLLSSVAMCLAVFIMGFRTQTLILHDALTACYLLTMAWLSICITAPIYSRYKKADRILVHAIPTFSLLFFATIFSVYANASSFGPEPACNSTVDLVILRPIRLLPAGRAIGLVFYSIVAACYAYGLGTDLLPRSVIRRLRGRSGAKSRRRAVPAARTAPSSPVPSLTPTAVWSSSPPGSPGPFSDMDSRGDRSDGPLEVTSNTYPPSSTQTLVGAPSPISRPANTRRRSRPGRARSLPQPLDLGQVTVRPQPRSQTSPPALSTPSPPRSTSPYRPGLIDVDDGYSHPNIDPTIITTILVIMIGAAFAIVNVELLHHFNTEHSPSSEVLWDYGQVLAVVILAMPLHTTLKIFRAQGLAPRSDEEGYPKVVVTRTTDINARKTAPSWAQSSIQSAEDATNESRYAPWQPSEATGRIEELDEPVNDDDVQSTSAV